ncbi:MAG: cell division protein ZapE [Pseudomonadota bacterium]
MSDTTAPLPDDTDPPADTRPDQSIAALIDAGGYQTPLSAYDALITQGALKANAEQAYIAKRLNHLHHKLDGYEPQGVDKPGFMARFGLGAKPRDTSDKPRGLYIYGGVGRGKSMLMDLFHQTVPLARKQRVHFHRFMIDVHARLHQHRKAVRQGADHDVIAQVADQIAAESWLLCFDEFHVTNITDAMILGRLFEALFNHGVVVIATSNWAPDDLYKDGLQRELFLPFIAMIKEQLEVVDLDHGTDYRQARIQGMATYLHPDDARATRTLDQAFDDLSRSTASSAITLTIQGRTLIVPVQANGVARFHFDELCRRALGAADYLALAQHYHTLILEHVPDLGEAHRNEAKRLILLIDALYEAKRRLLLSSEVPVDQLYPRGDHAFEFQRTLSRLQEMQSRDYLDQVADDASLANTAD